MPWHAPRSEADSLPISRHTRIEWGRAEGLNGRESLCFAPTREPSRRVPASRSESDRRLSLDTRTQTTSPGLRRFVQPPFPKSPMPANCKVNFDRMVRVESPTRQATTLTTLNYGRVLQKCHALARERTASPGQIRRFELSPTVRRAKRLSVNN